MSPAHVRRNPARPSLRSRRGLLVPLLLASGFVSGFGAHSQRGEAPRVAVSEPATTGLVAQSRRKSAAHAAAPIDSASAASNSVSSVVAEYAPVSIESLPIYREPGDGAAHAGSHLPFTVVTRGVIRQGETLASALGAQGISRAIVGTIAREMRPVFDFRRSRPGDRYRLGQDASGRLLDFRYYTGPEQSFYLFWEGTRFLARRERAKLHPQLTQIYGVVETSLYNSVRALGEQAELANDFADIFAWDIDFSRSVRPGDDFDILYQRLYRTDDDGDPVYVKPGRILAARYRGARSAHVVVYYEGADGHGAYYRPDGSSVERAFLVAPLEFSRISSSFSNARRHPILHIVRPHNGIDYAAPRGTPIWAVGEGTVIFRGWAGASGNLVKVRHANGYVSYYAHMSRFAAGLHNGDHVVQKQVIGYVGSTGLATGPHVCFRVQKRGHYVNPLEIASPAGAAIDEAEWAAFARKRDALLSDLGSGQLVAADEAL